MFQRLALRPARKLAGASPIYNRFTSSLSRSQNTNLGARLAEIDSESKNGRGRRRVSTAAGRNEESTSASLTHDPLGDQHQRRQRQHQHRSEGSWGKRRMMLVGGIAGLFAASAKSTVFAEGDSSPPSAVSVYDVPLGKKMPDVVPCFIEVSRGSRNKYEWDNSMGFLKLDRVLHSAVFYPHNYGFLPQTLCGDGDPLDVLVMGDLPLVPGSLVDVRPIAYMIMEDEKGMDEKVLAVVNKDPHYMEMHSLRDVPEHVLREIAHFFSTYKALEKKKWVKVGGWKGTADTKKLIEETHETYKEKKKEGPIEYAGN